MGVDEWEQVKISVNYEVSRNGEIRNLKSKKVIKPLHDKDGYLKARLMYRDTEWETPIHRLVAQTYIPNPENKPQVNHKDGIKSNNNVENLEWVTASENIRHAYDKQLRFARRGATNNWTKLTEDDVRLVFNLYHNNVTIKDIASKVNISVTHVNRLLNGERWGHLNLVKSPRYKNKDSVRVSKLKLDKLLE